MKQFLLSLIVCALGIIPAESVQALTCYAVTQGNSILTFDSATPGTVTNNQPISGINPAYSVVGIDIRTTTQTSGVANPGVGSLWGIAYNGTNFFLCVINPTTGIATQIGGILAMNDDALDDGFGFGFDPSTDRFRFISVQTNYAIDPNTATFVQQTSFAGFPAHSGAAFTTTFFGGSSTFYNISRQASPRTLQTTANISAGVLTQINPGGMGANVGQPLGLDIEGTLFLLANSTDSSLYTVNGATGTKSLVGAIGGAPMIRGLAILPTSFPVNPNPPASVTPTVSFKGNKIVTTNARVKVRGKAASSAGIERVQVRVGKKGAFKAAKGTTSWSFVARVKPGRNIVFAKSTGTDGGVSKLARIRVIRK